MREVKQDLPEGRNEERRPFLVYIVLFLSIPVLCIAGVVGVARSDWFFHHSSFGLQNIGYGLTLHHADCQVVLMGDSSALTALDPATVTQVTGLSACSVAEGGTVGVVIGTYPLDEYLRQNAAPKYIVIMNGPGMYTPASSWQAYSSFYEGMIYLLRYEPLPIVVKTVAAHPEEMMQFLTWVAHYGVTSFREERRNPHRFDGLENPMTRRQRQGGRFTYYGGAQTRCEANSPNPDAPFKVTDPSWPDAMRRRYGVHGTRVLVDVAPIPDCSNMQKAFASGLAGLHDNSLEILPIGLFNNHDSHLTQDGAVRVSTEVGEQILADMASHREAAR